MEAAIVLIRSINNKAPPIELINHCRRRIGDAFGFRIFHTILRSDCCHILTSLATGTTQAVLADCPNTEMPLLVRLAYIPVLPRKSVGGRSWRSRSQVRPLGFDTCIMEYALLKVRTEVFPLYTADPDGVLQPLYEIFSACFVCSPLNCSL